MTRRISALVRKTLEQEDWPVDAVRCDDETIRLGPVMDIYLPFLRSDLHRIGQTQSPPVYVDITTTEIPNSKKRLHYLKVREVTKDEYLQQRIESFRATVPSQLQCIVDAIEQADIVADRLTTFPDLPNRHDYLLGKFYTEAKAQAGGKAIDEIITEPWEWDVSDWQDCRQRDLVTYYIEFTLTDEGSYL